MVAVLVDDGIDVLDLRLLALNLGHVDLLLLDLGGLLFELFLVHASIDNAHAVANSEKYDDGAGGGDDHGRAVVCGNGFLLVEGHHLSLLLLDSDLRANLILDDLVVLNDGNLGNVDLSLSLRDVLLANDRADFDGGVLNIGVGGRGRVRLRKINRSVWVECAIVLTVKIVSTANLGLGSLRVVKECSLDDEGLSETRATGSSEKDGWLEARADESLNYRGGDNTAGDDLLGLLIVI